MSKREPLTGHDRRVATRRVDRAAATVSTCRWVTIVVPFLLVLPLFSQGIFVLIGLMVILLVLPIISVFANPFESAADRIRARHMRTIWCWVVVASFFFVVGLAGTIAAILIGLEEEDLLNHSILAALSLLLCLYAGFVMIRMISGLKSAGRLNTTHDLEAAAAPPPAAPGPDVPPTTLPPRPHRN